MKKKIEQDPDNPIIMSLYKNDNALVSVGCSSKWLVKHSDDIRILNEGLKFIMGVKVTINGKRIDIYTDVSLDFNEETLDEYALNEIKAEEVNCSLDFRIPIYINDTLVFHGFIYGSKVPAKFHIDVFDVSFWNFDTKDFSEMGTYELFPDEHVAELKEN